MTIVTVVESSHVLTLLVGSAVRAILLAGATGLLLAAFRVKPAAARLFVWKGALYAGLAMPLLGLLLPPVGVSTPAFLETSHLSQAGTLVRTTEHEVDTSLPAPLASATPVAILSAADAQSGEEASAIVTSHPQPASLPSKSEATRWPSAIAIALYLGVAGLLLARFAIGLVFGARVVRGSQEIGDAGVFARLKLHSTGVGLEHPPRLAESSLISVPITVGVTQPTILLPTSWVDWDKAKLNAVIAHEISHVARRDTLTQRLSLLHRAVFWFSPFAWWLHRQLSDLAEQASDDAALLCGTDRNHYARTLLGFFEALHSAPGRVWWQGVAMAKAGQAEQRLERILAWRGAATMGLKKSIVIAIVALAIPVVYLAASIAPVSRTHDSQDIGQEPAPAVEQPPAIANTAPTAQVAVPAVPRATAASPAIYGTIVGSVAPVAHAGTGYSYGYGRSSGNGHERRNYHYDDEERFVIVSGNSESVTMSGSSEDARHAERLKKVIKGDFIWFQRDEKSYIIRDQATVDRARALWAPQEELGKKQEELGRQQEALGKQQEALGKKMEEVRVQVPDMTAQLDKLRAELKQLSAGATMEQVGNLQSEIGELQSKIGEIQSHAGDQQSKLGEEMGALGEQQGKLGEQQGKLGEQQGELAEKAEREMKTILDEALKNGKAQPEPESGSGSASL